MSHRLYWWVIISCYFKRGKVIWVFVAHSSSNLYHNSFFYFFVSMLFNLYSLTFVRHIINLVFYQWAQKAAAGRPNGYKPVIVGFDLSAEGSRGSSGRAPAVVGWILTDLWQQKQVRAVLLNLQNMRVHVYLTPSNFDQMFMIETARAKIFHWRKFGLPEQCSGHSLSLFLF